MYADKMTDSMKEAIEETKRRRTIQEQYNKEHNIIPKTIKKEIRELISNTEEENYSKPEKDDIMENVSIEKLEEEMKEAAKNLDFERAMQLRDIIFELKLK